MDRKRINKIIEIKENIKKDKEREIEATNLKMASISCEIKAIEGTISENYTRLYSTVLSGNDFAVLTDYLDCLDTSRSVLVCEKSALQENIDVLYQELYEYARELKMLCKLRDRVMTEFKKGETRREQKMLDEMALRLGDKKM
jgi:flagellar export protein FliJ